MSKFTCGGGALVRTTGLASGLAERDTKTSSARHTKRVGADGRGGAERSAGRRLAKAVVRRLPVTHLANLLRPKPRRREVVRAHGMGRVTDALSPVRRLPVDPVAPPGGRLCVNAAATRHTTAS